MINEMITELIVCLKVKDILEKEQGQAPGYLLMHIEDLKGRIEYARVDSV